MLGDGRLGDAELAPNDVSDRAGGVLLAGEKLEDAPPDGVAEDVEGVQQDSGAASPV